MVAVSSSGCDTGPTSKPAPRDSDVSTPELCDGAGRAVHPVGPRVSQTRTNSVRVAAFLTGASSVASTTGRWSTRCPPMRRSDGRT